MLLYDRAIPDIPGQRQHRHHHPSIVTMILAALFLKEPVTNKKVLGIFFGAIGALLLILGNGTQPRKATAT